MSEQQYPALWQFLGAYLHQDWQDEYESPNGALRDFVSGDPGFAVDLPTEIEQVLTSTADDATLEATLVNLGSFFVPSRAGQNPRDWLRHVKDETQLLVQDLEARHQSWSRSDAGATQNLEHLIGAYFHQDWNHVYATRDNAVADFVRRSPDRAASVPQEIDALLASTGEDEELASRLSAMGFDDASPDGDRAFLIELRTHILQQVPPE